MLLKFSEKVIVLFLNIIAKKLFFLGVYFESMFQSRIL